MNRLLLVLFGVGLFLAGCTAIPATVPTQTELATAEASPTEESTPEPTVMGTPERPLTLRLWVPPQFDPSSDSPAGSLLQARLDEFSARRPDVRIEVRVKSESGPGGLYESLYTASSAAQLAMPDLVALDYPQIQAAAHQGLIRPMDGMTSALDSQDWFDFARQIALVQNSIFGLPFAGDTLVQVYHPSMLEKPGTDWSAVLQSAVPLAFPAADPHSLFSLALYQAVGGLLYDEAGRAFLDEGSLKQVLNFYQEGGNTGTLPGWLVQFQSDDQAWQAFNENRAASLVTWASRFLSSPTDDLAVDQIPTEDGKPYTSATGWAWTLAAQDSQKRDLAMQLAEFLTESEFLARWTESGGFIPPRPSALDAWNRSEAANKLKTIAASAALAPLPDVLESLGPRMQAAVLQILNKELDAEAAARAAAQPIELP